MLLHIFVIGVCQDLIVKKDSSKIEATILKVDPQEITYTTFLSKEINMKIPKSEVSKILFGNGTELLLNSTLNSRSDTVLSYLIEKKIKVIRPGYDTLCVGDYIKFNVQLAAVVYNSFCNVPRRNTEYMTSFSEYLQMSNKENISLNVGFNFLFGKSPYVKHIIGANYLRTRAEYYYNHGSIGGSTFSQNTSVTDFINITSGLRFTVFRRLHIEPLISFNIVAYGSIRSSGTYTTMDMNTYIRTTTSFESTSQSSEIGNTVSLSPKISYQIPIRNLKTEVFISYNLAYRYVLPWYQFGFHIYPFKKLK